MSEENFYARDNPRPIKKLKQNISADTPSFKSRFDIGPNGAMVKKIILPPPYELTEQQKLVLSRPLLIPVDPEGNEDWIKSASSYINNLLSNNMNDSRGTNSPVYVTTQSNEKNNFNLEKDSRTVYVGNLPVNTEHNDLSHFFQRVFTKVLEDIDIADKNDAIIRTDVSVNGQYAFVECKGPVLATVLINLDSIVFQDKRLRIHRPQSYIKQNITSPPLNFKLKIRGIAGICPTIPVSTDAGVPKILQESRYKVFVGALPYNVLEPQLTELLESFGPLAALHLVRAPGVLHRSKGYAFCVWKDAEVVTDQAIQALNGLEIQGKQLVVKYSTSAAPKEKGNINSDSDALPPSNTAVETNGNVDVNAALKAAGITNVSVNNNDNSVNSNGNSPSKESHIQNSSDKSPLNISNVPTNIVLLNNMVEEEDLKDDEEYEDIREDIQGECAKFGELISLQMPRDGQYMCKVFLEYKTAEYAKLAQSALNGRQFGPNVVDAKFFVSSVFENLF